jgi:hypothetical protein
MSLFKLKKILGAHKIMPAKYGLYDESAIISS